MVKFVPFRDINFINVYAGNIRFGVIDKIGFGIDVGIDEKEFIIHISADELRQITDKVDEVQKRVCGEVASATSAKKTRKGDGVHHSERH